VPLSCETMPIVTEHPSDLLIVDDSGLHSFALRERSFLKAELRPGFATVIAELPSIPKRPWGSGFELRKDTSTPERRKNSGRRR
jgi:hypothetical protein